MSIAVAKIIRVEDALINCRLKKGILQRNFKRDTTWSIIRRIQ